MATSCKDVKTRKKKRGVEKFVAEDARVECPSATDGTRMLVAKKKYKNKEDLCDSDCPIPRCSQGPGGHSIGTMLEASVETVAATT